MCQKIKEDIKKYFHTIYVQDNKWNKISANKKWNQLK